MGDDSKQLLETLYDMADSNSYDIMPSVRGALRSARNCIAALQSQLAAAKSEVIRVGMVNDNNVMCNQLEIADLRQQLASRDAEVSKQAEHIAQLREQHGESQAEIHDLRIALEARADERDAEIERMNRVLSETKDAFTVVEGLLKTSKERITQLTEANERLRQAWLAHRPRYAKDVYCYCEKCKVAQLLAEIERRDA